MHDLASDVLVDHRDPRKGTHPRCHLKCARVAQRAELVLADEQPPAVRVDERDRPVRRVAVAAEDTDLLELIAVPLPLDVAAEVALVEADGALRPVDDEELVGGETVE